jgi:hypothetical protein
MQGSDPKKAHYYIPTHYRFPPLFTSAMLYEGFVHIKRSRPFKKDLTDSVVMEFGREHGSIFEYSNLALANVINNKRMDAFRASIGHLDKEEQKMLRMRCQFLFDNELQCIPLNKEILDRSFLLLQEFMEQHNVKQNFRNSWNDMLILATALFSGADLVTKDNELNRFVAKRYAPFLAHEGLFLHLSFGKVEISRRQSSRESKGYINHGWKARFHHYK